MSDGLPNPKTGRLLIALVWDGTKGEARYCGTSVELDEPPKLSTVKLVRELYYEPQLRNHSVRASGEQRRELTGEEQRECLAILKRMGHDAREAVTQAGDLT
jgi:hypothetical protein